MPRLVITVNFKELKALVGLALAELRSPRDQLRYILRRELNRRKLLCEETKPQVFDEPREEVKDE
jgi:hypothetical protein